MIVQNRTLALLLSLIPAFGLSACGDDETSTSTSGGSGGGATTTSTADSSSSSAQSSSSAGGMGQGGSFEGVDPLGGSPTAQLIQGGFSFTEGPVYIAALGVVRFSDIPQNRVHEYTLASGSIGIWREPSANTNGNGLTANGALLSCEHAGRRVVANVVPGAPDPTLVADRYMGMRFNSPNDVIARTDGNIYFTDPTYGLGGGTQEIPFRGVFRVAPGGAVALVDDTLTQPNGIALSPDETKLYASDSAAGGLYEYAVMSDGATGPGSQLIDAPPSDGMAIDDAGNLYLTTAAGVEVYRSDGSSWGVLPVAEQPANVSFGGPDRRTLYITARTGFYQATLAVPGLP